MDSRAAIYGYFSKPSRFQAALGAVAPSLLRIVYDVRPSGNERVPERGPLVVATGPHSSAIDVGFAIFLPELRRRLGETAVVAKESLQTHPLVGRLQHIPAYRGKAEEGSETPIVLRADGNCKVFAIGPLSEAESDGAYRLSEQECSVLGIDWTGGESSPLLDAANKVPLLRKNTFAPAKNWLDAGKVLLISVEGTRYPQADVPEEFDPVGYSRLEVSKLFGGTVAIARASSAKILPVYTGFSGDRDPFGRKPLAVRAGYPIEPPQDRRGRARATEEIRYQLLALQSDLFGELFPDYSSFRGFFDRAFELNGGPPSAGSMTWQPFSERLAEYEKLFIS
ncbi:MAG: hypothetical protein V1820_00385 [archaeon]